jgi:uncharacterized protein YjbI with pentapeptide repeats
MADPGIDEQPETQIAEADQGCPVEMLYAGRCGRPVYLSPAGSKDRNPVCLMHSHDPGKDDAAFQVEFDRILREAGDGVADFSHFVFLAADYEGRTFKAECVFYGATFVRDANFRSATFLRAVSFAVARFLGVAVFCMAKFEGQAHFSHATFSGVADIRFGTFEKDVDFVGAEFRDTAEFSKRSFRRAVSFEEAWFRGAVSFDETIFRKDGELYAGPVFVNARFQQPDCVLFNRTYLGQALFHNCEVSKLVFRDVEWRLRENGKSKVFEEDVGFYSRVTKPLEPKKGAADERNYRLISELYHALKKNYDDRHDYWTAGDFHYGEMEMERRATPEPNRLSRWIAGKIKTRLAIENPAFLARWAMRKGYSERSFHALRRVLHRHVGLAAWYKHASEYGESYGRPLLWLVGILLSFMFLFPIWGLWPAAKSSPPEQVASESRPVTPAQMPELSYGNYFHHRSPESGGMRVTVWSLLGNSFMTTIGVASFQRELAYQPAYPWGRLLAILEALLTSTLLALFLLAVRRQFRR